MALFSVRNNSSLKATMGKSQDSFNKKEREKKRQKKRKEKLERKLARKASTEKPAEFMYVDAEGNLTTEKPDPTVKKEEIKLEDIQISTPKKEHTDDDNFIREGKVKFFNAQKGYGFITDIATRENLFVHIDNCNDVIKENDKVHYEPGNGPRGPIARSVSLITS